jgi:hypothetical protein
MKRLYIIIACVLSISMMPVAYGQKITKEKKISGRFSADKGRLVIDNRYGNLDINTWDRNEITVDITITAKSGSASDAQELVDRVRITEPKNNGQEIYYKTEIENRKTGINNSEFRIDYVINMPRRHTAEFINKYGNIDLQDLEGKLTIQLQYGSLKTGTLKGGDKNIKVDYGSAIIPSIETGSIVLSYSKLSIEKAGSIKVFNMYQKTTIGTVQNLDIDQKYGDVKIGSANHLKGNIQYGSLTIDKLLKTVQMNCKHCSDLKFAYVGPEVDNIDVHSDFSNQFYHFDRAANLSANLQVSYGNIENKAGNVALISLDNNRPGKSTTYKGKIGSGNRGNMELDVSYGNVTFR